MISNIIVVVVIFICMVSFAFYKRDMLVKMFSLDVTPSANRFQKQLEQTADSVIKRLEEQIIQLEYLLEEADQKVFSLDQRIQAANEILNKENNINACLNQSINSQATTDMPIITDEKARINIGNYRDMDRNDKRSLIIEMANLGYDITEIAKTTGISKGEIILLLQLNKK